jgi:cytochrome c553
MMKVKSLRLALRTAILASVVAVVGHAEETKTTTSSERALQAKIQYCTYCHQLSGEGYPLASIPRLAGQQTEYFVNQLQAFIDRRRVNMFMFKVAHSLHPDTLPALAQHFSELNPKPVGGASSKLADAGKKIFEDGVPEANIPACAACHGFEARVKDPFPV